MMQNWKGSLVVLGAVAGMLVPGISAADPGASTHVDQLSASRSGSFVMVSGTATFVDIPTVVAEEAGDGQAYDVTRATISRPNPNSNTAKFTWDLASPGADLPTLTYMWPITVDGDDQSLWLQASRNNGTSNPGFALNQLGSTGSYTTLSNLTGTMTATKVEWNVPLSLIDAAGGSDIQQGGAFPSGYICAAGSTGGAAGFYSCSVTFDQVYFEDAEIPGAEVSVGIAPAGTLPEFVNLSTSASVNTSGAFSAAIDATGLPAGEYIVVAKACYGSGNCELSSTSVTI